MLKTTVLPKKLISDKLKTSNGKSGISIDSDGMEHAKKSEKLKTQNLLKSQKLFKSQKSAKTRKKLSKRGNSTNFDAKKTKLNFLIPKARMTFNCLWLAFTKALIL